MNKRPVLTATLLVAAALVGAPEAASAATMVTRAPSSPSKRPATWAGGS